MHYELDAYESCSTILTINGDPCELTALQVDAGDPKLYLTVSRKVSRERRSMVLDIPLERKPAHTMSVDGVVMAEYGTWSRSPLETLRMNSKAVAVVEKFLAEARSKYV